MKTKEIGWEENHGIQNIGIKDSEGNIIGDQKRALEIYKNYITEPYNWPKQPKDLEVNLKRK